MNLLVGTVQGFAGIPGSTLLLLWHGIGRVVVVTDDGINMIVSLVGGKEKKHLTDVGRHRADRLDNTKSMVFVVYYWLLRRNGYDDRIYISIARVLVIPRRMFCFGVNSFTINQSHKARSALAPYPTMHHSEQKCAHFCSEWCIVGYGTSALWDLWDCSTGVCKAAAILFIS